MTRRSIRPAVFVLLALPILGLSYLNRAPLQDAYRLATSHRPETYTELYFNDSIHLPTQVTAGKPYLYTVHIANHEAVPMKYQVVATIAVPNSQPVITHLTVSLAPGQATDKTFQLQLTQPHTPATIQVSLPAQRQYIMFRTKS